MLGLFGVLFPLAFGREMGVFFLFFFMNLWGRRKFLDFFHGHLARQDFLEGLIQIGLGRGGEMRKLILGRPTHQTIQILNANNDSLGYIELVSEFDYLFICYSYTFVVRK